jgi:probable phosphoglycerate mutase
MILYCVRHGESLFNAEGRVQGHLDVHLSELGRRQAEAVARALAERPIEVVYASPLQRALETAQIIARAAGTEVLTDRQLKEINVGVFQGRLRAEINQLYPREIACWSSEDPDYVVPGGESRRQLKSRGLAAFQAIIEAGHEQAVVVSHGRLLVTTLKALLSIPAQEPPFSLQNGSITTLAYHAGKVELVAMDDTDHLRSIGLSGNGDL